MKIAVTSQNRKTITEHAGRCRKFWIFSIDNNTIIDKQLLELPKEQCFHESSPHEPHPLDNIDILIAGSMGQGIIRRLGQKGIQGIVTSENDPENAVTLYLNGALVSEGAHSHDHEHSHGHHH